MKKYRLKQWYPRIPVYLEDGYIISFDDDKGIAIYEFFNGVIDTFEMSGAELECTQYWELIEEKEPLFVTADKVGIFEGDEYIAIGINYDFSKVDMVAHDQAYSGDVIRFKYESNADTYIWKNKPLFSYEDFMKWGNVPYERVIRELAIERIGNEN